MLHSPFKNIPIEPFNKDVFECENELKELGFSEKEIINLNNQIDGIIERGFDKYFSNFYESK